MKNIKFYEHVSAFTEDYKNNYEEPWVSYCPESAATEPVTEMTSEWSPGELIYYGSFDGQINGFNIPTSQTPDNTTHMEAWYDTQGEILGEGSDTICLVSGTPAVGQTVRLYYIHVTRKDLDYGTVEDRPLKRDMTYSSDKYLYDYVYNASVPGTGQPVYPQYINFQVYSVSPEQMEIRNVMYNKPGQANNG